MKKYDKIERFGKTDTEGILEGTIYVQEKIDGANASVYYDSSKDAVIVCSRNRELAAIGENRTETADSFRGLVEYVENNEGIIKMTREYPDSIFYGEWLVKHTIIYPEDSYNQLYFYDIDDTYINEFYSTPDAIGIFKKYEVCYVPILKKLVNTTIEEIDCLLNVNNFKGSPGQEGIVIKNPLFVNKWGRSPYAKIVNEKFTERKKQVWKSGKSNKGMSEQIALTYVTPMRVNKQIEKMCDGQNEINERRTGELIQRVYHDIVVEEIWEILKKWKQPTINFRALNKAIAIETRRIFFNKLEGRIIKE